MFRECIEDAKKITDSKIIKVALGLFDKRASHVVFLKEKKCKEKFDSS